MSDEPPVELRLERKTAVHLWDALYALKEHLTARTPLAALGEDADKALARLHAELGDAIGVEDAPTQWDSLKAIGLHSIADWGGPCPYQFTAWIEPEHKWLYFRVRDGSASIEVMPGWRAFATPEWEGDERYDRAVSLDDEPAVALPLFEKLIAEWRATGSSDERD